MHYPLLVLLVHILKANGVVERLNQTIQDMLVKFVQEKKETWESYIDTCIYAYNTSRHRSSLFTPFELMFECKAVIPVDCDKGSLLFHADITSNN